MLCKKKFDYRHIICIALTLGFVFLSLTLFSGGIFRLVESFIDLGLSIAYFFCNLFGIPYSFNPAVINESKIADFNGFIESFPIVKGSISLISFENFTSNWYSFWDTFANWDNFLSYLSLVGTILLYSLYALIIIFNLYLIFRFRFKRLLNKKNNDYNKESKPLKIWKGFENRLFKPVYNWCKDFIYFIKVHSFYKITWLIIWGINFNIFSILIEFIAFYFYFIFSFDFSGIFKQFYKLLVDLSVMFKVVPVIVWIIIALIIIDKIRKSIAKNRLRRYEYRNRMFINKRPIVLMLCGTMGKGKTTALTDMVLSISVMHREKALEKIIDNDLKFPNFPWINLEKTLQKAMDKHIVYNLATCRKFIDKLHYYFCVYTSLDNAGGKSYKRHIKKIEKWLVFDNFIFNYDYESYGFTYDDKLKVVDVWEVIKTYAQLYFIYIINSSFVLANYSIRTDECLADSGNFPLWDNDFFERDSRTIDYISKHSHILDFDALRLGKKVIDNNENANSFEFGVVAITEIGKERGNNLENIDLKKKDDYTNQKNDRFNDYIKMVRHSATVDNYPFIKFITDEQRPNSWGADARDLCDIVSIKDCSEDRLAMPLFQFGELLYMLTFNKFTNNYIKFRHNRGDNTLFMYLYKGISSKIHNYYTRIHNLYGYHYQNVQTESGTQDGVITTSKYYISHKKTYSKRFATDSLGDFFNEKSLKSSVGLSDIPEYESEKATFDELKKQNSYFIRNLMGIKEKDY